MKKNAVKVAYVKVRPNIQSIISTIVTTIAIGMLGIVLFGIILYPKYQELKNELALEKGFREAYIRWYIEETGEEVENIEVENIEVENIEVENIEMARMAAEQ